MRRLSDSFMSDLSSEGGLLCPILQRVKRDHTLMLSIRNDGSAMDQMDQGQDGSGPDGSDGSSDGSRWIRARPMDQRWISDGSGPDLEIVFKMISP